MSLVERLEGIVGRRHVLTGADATRRFSTGFRFGSGPVLAVARPGTLVEQWRVVQACVEAGAIVIMQAANTGLTGGSTPDGQYDRPVVIVSTMRLTGIQLIDQGQQVVCLPGATLYELERELGAIGREPHSVIGSSCIGASVLGGVCNNSGGALVQRGPAFTELALFARLDADGMLRLVNNLGIDLPDEPEAMLRALETRAYGDAAVRHPQDRRASDVSYTEHVRQIDAPTPARFNADPGRLSGASGSGGHVAVFAVRLDTFEKQKETAVFYVGASDVAELAEIRRDILAGFTSLPVAGEYMHRGAYDIAATYGKDTFLAIQRLGTDRLPQFFAWKARFDQAAGRLPFVRQGLSDRLLQWASGLFPSHLPARMNAYRDRYEHHLMLRMGGAGIEEARAYLAGRFPSSRGDFFECTPEEGAKAFLHRFATAGAAVRYRTVHAREVEDIIALDIALPRNAQDWFETLPADIEAPLLHKLYYGHFFCHVFHQDYIVAKGADPIALEHRMWSLLDARGAEYPAEHNVGHLYKAKASLEQHYRALDPCNAFNPGVGQLPRHSHWRETTPA